LPEYDNRITTHRTMPFHTIPDQLPLGYYGPAFFKRWVRLPVADLTRHVFVQGVTGVGKSRWLAGLALTLIRRGEGVTVLDPHGDTVRLIFHHLVADGVYRNGEAYARVTYLDLPGGARGGRYVPLAPLDPAIATPTAAGRALEALQRAWPALDGTSAPAFANAVLAGVSVLHHHKLPLVLLGDLFLDAPWRRQLLTGVTDATVRSFFTRLDGWGSRDQASYLESTLRRVFLLGFQPALRYSLGAEDNAIRWGERFDRGQSLLVNLALPDSDSRRLLTSLLTVGAEQAAMSRAGMPAGERGRAHTLIVDEWSDVAAQSGTAVTHLLEQTRKFGLGLVLAVQTGTALSERVRGAVGNVGTGVIFRLGRADAEEAADLLMRHDPYQIKHEVRDKLLRRRTHPVYMPLAEQREAWVGAITRLPAQHFFLRRGTGSVPLLTAPPLPDPIVDAATLAAVEARFLTTYFWPGSVVEAQLRDLRPATSPAPRTARRGRVGGE